MTGSHRRHYWLAIALASAGAAATHAQLERPGTGPAKGPDAPSPTPTPTATAATGAVQAGAPIVPDAEFNAALPPLSGNLNAPLEPMKLPTAPATPAASPTSSAPASTTPAAPTGAATAASATLPPTGTGDPQLNQPLTPLASYSTVPLETAADVRDKDAPKIRYDTQILGLDAVNLKSRWQALSALRNGHGKADNATQVSARAKEDEALAVRLMKSLGYYDGTATSVIEQTPKDQKATLTATVTAVPGTLYKLGTVTVTHAATTPADLVEHNLPIHTGDPIQADRIEGAEANVALVLPQQGYPFVKVGDRDILLDEQTFRGDYTLPVDTGPRSSFGQLTTTGDDVFGLPHLNVFPRFKQGDLYDSRKRDDLHDALVATGLFSSISVEPQQTGRTNPDGTQAVDLLVRQVRGPEHSLAAQAGYATGQGYSLTGSYTDRNRFPEEGALILTGIGGSQEQGASATFRRSDAGQRDKTFSAILSVDHTNYNAFNAFTATISARWSYVSTPIWQKKFTYYYGGEIVGTNESVYDYALGDRTRRNYLIAALPVQVQFDTSDSLLNPTRGYRLALTASPETSVQGAVSPYARLQLDGSYYQPLSSSLVLAGRVRVASILGISRDDLAPSRRYYGGGGGSVRGYGYQRLGPFDPQGNPVGGRSLEEFSIEARYRFGNYGIVPFFDGGNAYEQSTPQFGGYRYGVGIGGRLYTNFGPLRIDVATPLNPRPGDGKIALYISIGQAF
ncbi:autotransporter assembly complex family protein [uncultured Sphingomonas sp.]|uniref:autotransporter assembly complex protein TamA n=1 Tax=uncultured Sphingomonas sp. TaxID=158754 RepID=UPI0035C975E7